MPAYFLFYTPVTNTFGDEQMLEQLAHQLFAHSIITKKLPALHYEHERQAPAPL